MDTSTRYSEKPTNKALKKGFVDGFTAPFSFFCKSAPRTEKYHASVERAWRDVGDAFHDVMSKEGVIRGEGRNETRRRSNREAA